MLITILTLFPEIFPPVFNSSITGRAQKKRLVTIRYINIRDFATDKRKSVDDRPYGGGPGMIMRVDVLDRAITNAKIQPKADQPQAEKIKNEKSKQKIVLLDPKGKIFNQSIARRYSKLEHLMLVCGHYEGVDARISGYIDEAVSLGRYIVTGGEIPAMMVADSVIRLINGVLAKREAVRDESFSLKDNLEPPQYTRPPVYKNEKVPSVLLSGNHTAILAWKKSH